MKKRRQVALKHLEPLRNPDKENCPGDFLSAKDNYTQAPSGKEGREMTGRLQRFRRVLQTRVEVQCSRPETRMDLRRRKEGLALPRGKQERCGSVWHKRPRMSRHIEAPAGTKMPLPGSARLRLPTIAGSGTGNERGDGESSTGEMRVVVTRGRMETDLLSEAYHDNMNLLYYDFNQHDRLHTCTNASTRVSRTGLGCNPAKNCDVLASALQPLLCAHENLPQKDAEREEMPAAREGHEALAGLLCEDGSQERRKADPEAIRRIIRRPPRHAKASWQKTKAAIKTRAHVLLQVHAQHKLLLRDATDSIPTTESLS